MQLLPAFYFDSAEIIFCSRVVVPTSEKFQSCLKSNLKILLAKKQPQWWVGTGGWEPGRKGVGGRRREGGKRESQGGRNWEKLRKFCNILLYFVIIIDMGQRGGNHYGKGWEMGVKVTGRGRRRYGRWEFQTPCPSLFSDQMVKNIILFLNRSIINNIIDLLITDKS